MKMSKRGFIVLFGIVDFLMIVFLLSMLVRADYVNSENGLRIRKKPSTDSEILGVLPYGEEVEGTKVGDWIKIEKGYVFAEYVQETDPLDGLEFIGDWNITAYTWTGYQCANGNYPTDGYTIAHNSLPFGTRVYIQGLGTRVVEDRGPSSLGTRWCDLYMSSYNACVQWGSQNRRVYLIER